MSSNGPNTERRHRLGGPGAGAGTRAGRPATRGRAQRGRFNARSGTVIALVITSRPQTAGFPLTMELTGVKLPKRSWVKISQIRTLSTQRVGAKIGRLSADKLQDLIDGLNEILGS